MDLLPQIPNKGWCVWDEVGVALSHRRWQSEINVQIMQVIQSFRYKLINVIFTVPSASYVDKVPREMCHYVIRMQRRGVASVYRIRKSPFEGFTYTPFLGTIYTEMPTEILYQDFRRSHTEHQERLYEQSRQRMEASEKRDKERLDKALNPKDTMQVLVDKARLILPQIVNPHKDTDQGLINVVELRRILDIPHNKAYNIRNELLVELHANEDSLLKELRKRK